MFELLFILALLILGFVVGGAIERRHYTEIRQREKLTLHLPMMNLGCHQPLPEAQASEMFVGSVVVSTDYFKTFIAGLGNLVGGNLVTYESLIDRGRREAILRMKEQAIAWGATQLINVRFETANIGGQSSSNGLVAIEVMAYGTAIRESANSQ
ncbi:MAG: heavy metal-binding domain-containing protein [Cyanobacteria bacterium P01_A01_bin.123]